jgi:hypothetical protein
MNKKDMMKTKIKEQKEENGLKRLVESTGFDYLKSGEIRTEEIGQD